MNDVNTWRRWPLLAGLFVVLTFGQTITGFAQDETAAPTTTLAGAYAPGEVLVGLRASGVRSAALLTTMEAQVVETIAACGVTGSGLGFRLRVPEGSEQAAIAELEQDSSVLFAEPNWLVYAADSTSTRALAQPETPFVVNDPSYVDRQWYLQRIGASRAWGLTYGGDGFQGQLTTIQVAVVDSGIDINHPEFSEMLLPGKNYVTAGTAPVDKYGHGTHVAGLIGAITNNRIGMAGIAPKVKIDPRKVLNDVGSGTIDNVVRGICEAADAGANIINLSLETSQRSLAMEAAVQYAADKGVLLVAASGNSGLSSVAYPAAFADVMAIAATTYADVRASYSNYSATAPVIELAAPGGASPQSIYSTWAKGAWCRDNRAPLAESGYCTSEGTSMAAAVVTGAAALVWSLDTDQSADDVRALLRATATPISSSANQVGSGRLDLHAAVRTLLPNDVKPSEFALLYAINPGQPPVTGTLRLENPSGATLAWATTLIGPSNAVQLMGADQNGLLQGEARYGQPSYLNFLVQPESNASGGSNTTLQVRGVRTDATPVLHEVTIDVVIGALTPQSYLPLVVRGGGGTIPPPLAGWETPVLASDRTGVTLRDESEATVTLPFTFTLQGLAYSDVRLNANGFVSFGEATLTNSQQSVCLPNKDEAGAAIYGWWADLDPSGSGARVSTFQPATDRFVVEYDSIPTAAKSGLTYTVSFQIVLYRNGDISLHYGQAPVAQVQPPPVTIGVEARDGLFYNQIACKDANIELGYLPTAQQSFYLDAEESIH